MHMSESAMKSKTQHQSNLLFDLTGKTVLITGGGSGLGLAIAKTITHAGANVIITGRREDVLQNTCIELGDKAVYKVFDLARLEQIPAFVDEIESTFGPVDVLVNNAGINMKKDILDVTDEDFSTIVQINQTAV